MTVNVTPDQLVKAFERDWPLQYEITLLRIVAAEQEKQLTAVETRTEETER